MIIMRVLWPLVIVALVYSAVVLAADSWKSLVFVYGVGAIILPLLVWNRRRKDARQQAIRRKRMAQVMVAAMSGRATPPRPPKRSCFLVSWREKLSCE
jgi:hypothetical protein